MQFVGAKSRLHVESITSGKLHWQDIAGMAQGELLLPVDSLPFTVGSSRLMNRCFACERAKCTQNFHLVKGLCYCDNAFLVSTSSLVYGPFLYRLAEVFPAIWLSKVGKQIEPRLPCQIFAEQRTYASIVILNSKKSCFSHRK